MQRPDPSSQNTDWMVCKGDILVFARYVSCQIMTIVKKKFFTGYVFQWHATQRNQ